jgi:hypothetical protein
MGLIERDAILRAASDYAEAVLEHGDPALRPGFEQFRATVDDALTEHARGAVDLAERYGEAIIAISAALPDVNRVWAIIASLDTRGK